MANILIGATGSVASVKIPELFRAIRNRGHEAKVVATKASLYFFDPREIDAVSGSRNPDAVVLDEDEWPGRSSGVRYHRGDTVRHIELRRWADLFLIAPLDANTLAKLACGICDNCLTCVYRAWDPGRPIIAAPAMNTFMWDHPLTGPQIQSLVNDSLDPSNVRIVGPQVKELACGDVGAGGMADIAELADAVDEMLVRDRSAA